jgi:hypothetical protein
MDQAPIFILGLHKSGTSLSRNLLDRHLKLFVISFEIQLFELYRFWVDIECRRSRQKSDSSIVKYAHKVNTTIDKFGDSFTEDSIVVEKFKTSFTSKMLNPTVLNKPWKENSTSGSKMDGMSSKRLNVWKKEIHPRAVFYINKFFHFLLDDYEYESHPAIGSFFTPGRHENLGRYFVIRLYRIYLHHLKPSKNHRWAS